MNRKRWRLALLLWLASASTAARAEDWREFRRSETIVGALNVGEAKRSGSTVEIAMLLVPKAQPLAPVLVYTIMDIRADCDGRTAQILGSQNYAGAKAVGERTPADPAPTRSTGDGLDPLCAAAALPAPGTQTAFDFAQRAWAAR